MDLKEAFQEIESIEFSADFGVVSGLRPFLMAVSEQEVVLSILDPLNSEENQRELFFRIYDLSHDAIDLRSFP